MVWARSVADSRLSAPRSRRPSRVVPAGVGDVVGDEGGVPSDPADEVRAAAVLEPLAEHVQPGHRASPLAAAGSRRRRRARGRAASRTVPSVTGRPDDGGDPFGAQVERVDHRLERHLGRDGSGSSTSSLQSVLVDVTVDRGQRGGRHPRCGVGDRARRGRRPAAPGAPSTAATRADEADAGGLQRGQVERTVVRAARRAAATARAGLARRRASRRSSGRAVRCARATRRCPSPGSAAARGCGRRQRARRRGPTRAQLVRQLHAGRRRPDHEYAAAAAARPGVGMRAGRSGRRRQSSPSGDSRYRRPVTPAGRDDHVGGPLRSRDRCPRRSPSPSRRTGSTRVCLLDRCGERARRSRRDESANSAADMNPSGSPPRYAPVGERVHPVRREQVQRVPRVAVPALAETAPLQHHVVAAACR